MAMAQQNYIIIKCDVFLAKLQSLIFHFLFASSSKSRLLIFGPKFYLYKPNTRFCTDIFLPLGYPRVAGTEMHWYNNVFYSYRIEVNRFISHTKANMSIKLGNICFLRNIKSKKNCPTYCLP